MIPSMERRRKRRKWRTRIISRRKEEENCAAAAIKRKNEGKERKVLLIFIGNSNFLIFISLVFLSFHDFLLASFPNLLLLLLLSSALALRAGCMYLHSGVRLV